MFLLPKCQTFWPFKSIMLLRQLIYNTIQQFVNKSLHDKQQQHRTTEIKCGQKALMYFCSSESFENSNLWYDGARSLVRMKLAQTLWLSYFSLYQTVVGSIPALISSILPRNCWSNLLVTDKKDITIKMSYTVLLFRPIQAQWTDKIIVLCKWLKEINIDSPKEASNELISTHLKLRHF